MNKENSIGHFFRVIYFVRKIHHVKETILLLSQPSASKLCLTFSSKLCACCTPRLCGGGGGILVLHLVFCSLSCRYPWPCQFTSIICELEQCHITASNYTSLSHSLFLVWFSGPLSMQREKMYGFTNAPHPTPRPKELLCSICYS